MALTREEVNNAIVRAKCGLSDIYAELVKARAQGSKKAEELRRKAAKLFAFISALENVLDCDPPPTSTANPSGPICDVDALFVAKCYTPDPDVIGTGFLNLLVAAGSSSIPYQDYTYTYYTSDSADGPWTDLSTLYPDAINKNTLIDMLVGSDDAYIKITVECGNGVTRDIITQTKTVDGSEDYNTFGYIKRSTVSSASPLNLVNYVLDTDSITISNLNSEFIISSITNVNTSAVLGTNINSKTILVNGNIANNQQLAITFRYLTADFPCEFTRLVTIKVVPNPIIVPTATSFCPGGSVDLTITNYAYSTYLWSTGETTQTITVDNPGLYACVVSVPTISGLLDYQSITLVTAVPEPYIAFASTGLPVPDGYAYCTVFEFDLIVKDNYYTSGYPTGTTVSWTGYGITGDPATTFVSSGLGSIFEAVVTVPNVPCPQASETITLNPVLAAGPAFIQCTPSNVQCFGSANGSLTFTSINPDTTAIIVTLLDTDGVTPLGSSNITTTPYTFTGLVAGVYTYQVDITVYGIDCTSINGLNSTITQPAMLTGSYVQTDVSCFGGSDGSITVTITGGAAPYAIDLSHNTYILATPGDITIVNLATGTYELSVIDGNGCSVSIDSAVVITEPDAIKFTAEATACYEALNPGVITYSGFTGGSGTLSALGLVDDDNAVVIEDITSLLPISTYDFLNLPVGDYRILAYDSNGCAALSDTITIIPC